MAKISNYIGYGLHADRPAAGAPGAIYFESDTGNGYRDNGSSWDMVVSGPLPSVFPLSILAMADDLTLTRADVFVVCTDAAQVAGKALTVPHAADWRGHIIYVITPLGNVPTITVQSPDTLQGNTPGIMISDGTDWYGVDR